MVWREAIRTLTPFVSALAVLSALGLYCLLQRRAIRYAQARIAASYCTPATQGAPDGPGAAKPVAAKEMLVSRAAEHKHAEAALAPEARELAHSNALLASLSRVAARVAATTSPGQAMSTLGKELEALGLGCYIAELDPVDRAIIIRYISVKPPALRLSGKVLGLNLFDTRIPYERWAKSGDAIQHDGPVLVGNLVSIAADTLALPRQVISRAARIAGISPETPAIHLPLVIAEQSRGVLVVWGASLGERDIPALEIFAHQVAVTIENAGLYERERQQSARLARSNTFIAALSRVAARVASAHELDHILEALGAELRQIDVTCIVALLEPDRQSMLIHYTSIESSVMAAAERLLGAGMVGFRMRRERCPFWAQLIERGEAVFVRDAVEMAAASMPGVLKTLIAQAFRLGGWSDDDFVIWLPLSAGDRIEGGLAVWGPDLRQEDVPTLSVFASQVGITIENVRLYTAERKRAEENEVLLKEIHHRVKNNLQVVSSLLHLQSGHIDDERVVQAFAESQNRIRSMALVHEKLYQSPDLVRIDFGDYVRELATQLLGTYRAGADEIALLVSIGEISLDVDQAIICGLILNELLSNALKHAFPDGRAGSVRVDMHAQRGRLSLQVSDNGIGLPDDMDIERAGSLGLELVQALVRQLEGTLSIKNRDGCKVAIQFAPD